MSKEELIDKTDQIIAELVYPKFRLLKAYNYYNGIRDPELFKYLEEKFGTSTPTTITFTPLIKKHVDAIIGEYLGTPIIPKVFCKDKETINNIDREKQLKISEELYKYLLQHLKNSILKFIDGKNINDPLIELEMLNIKDNIDSSFTSEYEIAALNVLEYIMLSRDTDIMQVLRDLLMDLLITGYTFYKVEPTVGGNGIRIKALNPLNVFIDRNIESPYVKNSHRAVVRHWMSKAEILSKYGKELSKDDRKLIEDKWDSLYDESVVYIHGHSNSFVEGGILSGVEVTPGFPFESTPGYPNSRGFRNLIPVYEVEWIETDSDFIMQRYETIRIAEEIYITRGKNEEVIRSLQDPSYCGLSINGVYLLNRGYLPYSLVLACADQQD